jgi:large repetitive protein
MSTGCLAGGLRKAAHEFMKREIGGSPGFDETWPAYVLATAVWLLVLTAASSVRAGNATHPAPAKSDRGFQYLHDTVPAVPWSIHMVKIDRAHADLELYATLGQGGVQGMATVPDMIKLLPPAWGRVLAAINGDFFHNRDEYPGDPQGLLIRNGELVSAPSAARSCFWIDARRELHLTNMVSKFSVTWPDGTQTPFGLNEERASDAAVLYTTAVGPSTRTSSGPEYVLEPADAGPCVPLPVGKVLKARVREVRNAGNTAVTASNLVLSIGPRLASRAPKLGAGAVLQLSTATVPDAAGARTALGGGPALIQGGKARRFGGWLPRHPRSAIGWNKEFIFLVEVDGRQAGLSAGMSLPELADYLVKLGCEEGLNLDGGGSAALWVMGNVVNSPSEGRERPSANALVLVRREKPGP